MPAHRKPRRAPIIAVVALLGAGTTYFVSESDPPPTQASINSAILEAAPRQTSNPIEGHATKPARGPAVSTPRARSAALPARPKKSDQNAPTRVDIPSLGVSMPIKPSGVNRYGGAAIPTNPAVAGWYRFGSVPGAPRGATVLMAHVDDAQRLGPLAAMASLSPGDRINVTTSDGSVSYHVDRVGRVPKDDLDTDALFSRNSAPRLHVVTCGGPFDEEEGGYRDNVVAVAVPVQ